MWDVGEIKRNLYIYKKKSGGTTRWRYMPTILIFLSVSLYRFKLGCNGVYNNLFEPSGVSANENYHKPLLQQFKLFVKTLLWVWGTNSRQSPLLHQWENHIEFVINSLTRYLFNVWLLFDLYCSVSIRFVSTQNTFIDIYLYNLLPHFIFNILFYSHCCYNFFFSCILICTSMEY